jgi:conjugal transfer ATP-binding protein TraC
MISILRRLIGAITAPPKRRRSGLDPDQIEALEAPIAGPPSAAPPLLPAPAERLVVRLPTGPIAGHPWQALRPAHVMPHYTPTDEALAARLLTDEHLNLFGDDAGTILRHISPQYAREEKLHYELGDRVGTTIAIKRWQKDEADPSFWLRFLRDLAFRVPEYSISMHHWRIGVGVAERSLKREIERREVELEELRKAEGETARVAQMEQDLIALKAQRQAIVYQRETLFHLSCYIRVTGATLDELRDRVAAIEEIARQVGLQTMQLPGEQRAAFISSMPYASDPAYLTRLRGSSVASTVFPIVTRPHQERNRDGKNPVVLYGIHAADMTPVLMSPWNADETMEITSVLGRPGSGKSYWLRCHLGRLALVGVQTITIDPLGDFIRWHKENEATIIEIAPDSEYHVNPLRREIEADGEIETVDEKVQRLLPLFRFLIGTQWDEVASGLISSGLRRFYDRYGTEERLMADFIDVLKEVSESEAGRLSDETMARRAKIIDTLALNCLQGAYRSFFAHKSNIVLDPSDPRTQKILFNLSRAGTGDVLTFAIFLAVTMAVNIAKQSHHRKIILIDEVHRLYAAQRAAEAISDMLRDLIRIHRHWNCALTFATQFVDDDATNRSQAAILRSSNIWVLLRATEAMLNQSIDLIGKAADPDLLMRFLRVSGTTDEAARRDPKPMVIYRNGEAIPMYSVGLSFEDAEDDRNSGLAVGR